MGKKVFGYVRNITNADPISGVTVTIRDRNNAAVPGGTANPTTTAADGSFSWSIDLSPGPVYVDVTISGSERKINHGRETMQVDSVWTGDILELGKVFTNGVVSGELNQLACTVGGGTRQLSLNTGRAILKGYSLGIDTALTLTGTANAGIALRHDLVVLRQYISGADIGKQQIVLVEGSVSGVDPAINTVADTFDLAIWRAVLPQNATAYNAPVDLRVYASVVLDTDLTALAGLSGTGLAVRTGDGAWATRSIVAGSGKLVVTNGSGVAGNPSIDLGTGIDAASIANGLVSNTEFQYLDGVTSAIQAQIDGKQAGDTDLTALAGLGTTGFVVRTGAGAAATRSLGAGSGISIANPDGVAGNPTITALAHTHTRGALKTAFGAKSYNSTEITSTTGQDLLSISLPLSAGVTYDVFAVATAEGFAAGGVNTLVQLGVQIGANVTDWGSEVSSENESAPVSAFSADDALAAGGAVTVTMRAKASAAGGNCWIRSGFLWAIGIPVV